jgi:glutamate transport system permease protein
MVNESEVEMTAPDVNVEEMAEDTYANREGFTRSTLPHSPKLKLTKAQRKLITRKQRKARQEQQSVLFDEPGPRAQKRIRVLNVIGVVLFIALVAWILIRFANPPMGENQLSWKLWEPALNGRAWMSFYLPGIASTLAASVVAIAGAAIFGFLFALGRLSSVGIIRAICSVIVEFCRAVPVLLFMIFFWRLFAGMGMGDSSPFWAVCAGLTCYNGSVVTELIRSGVGNLPVGQKEAATALGMSNMSSLMRVQIPQAVISSMPALISQLVVVLKDSALGSVISYADLLQRARRLGSLHFNPLQTIMVAGVIYLILCGLFSRLAQWIPERMQRHTTGIARQRVIQPEAILDPTNLNQQERASHELPFGGVEPEIPDHYHGSNAVVSEKWHQEHREEGHDFRRPEDRRPWYRVGHTHRDDRDDSSESRQEEK